MRTRYVLLRTRYVVLCCRVSRGYRVQEIHEDEAS